MILQLQKLVDESQAEAIKERKLRERVELFVVELEHEMEELKRGRRSHTSHKEVSQELSRLVQYNAIQYASFYAGYIKL